jgi:biopolymer transport protein ExbD
MNPTNADIYAPATKKARLEIIPLIDVIFFLLATFVLFTLSLNKIKSIEAVFPVPAITPGAENRTIYLQATDGGMFFWKHGDVLVPELLTAAELPARLADYCRREPVPRVLVRGDHKSRFGSTVVALDAVRLAGITEVSVETLVTPSGR